DRTPALRLRF
uniref:FMRFamide-like neuropeptide FLP5 n=1 Tax=Macrobrachium rosenbergii TaxID=79674 RepID=FAR5_MACRS|nr:RecName: Full=FMRFamide-like neuropeptide FLP5; AltName: Full=DRTPALRLRF-amide [Macrobrachium rosenbergii]